MTKEEYLNREESLKNKIEEIREEIKNLRKQYIKDNIPYPIGTKVKIESKNYPDSPKGVRVGVVTDFDVSFHGDVMPIIMKMKKDGTAHATNRLYCCWFEKVEPIGT